MLLFDVAKHIYDVSVMLETNEIKRMLDDCKMFREMLQYKRWRMKTGLENLAEKACDFKIFSGLSETVN